MKISSFTISDKDIRKIKCCPKCGRNKKFYIVVYSDCVSLECDACDNHMVLNKFELELID